MGFEVIFIDIPNTTRSRFLTAKNVKVATNEMFESKVKTYQYLTEIKRLAIFLEMFPKGPKEHHRV